MLATRARRCWLITIGAAVLCLPMAGCAEQPGTSQAQEVHSLYYVILALAAVVLSNVDEPVHVHLVSNDVMHEFFVPAFFFMRNAIPGFPNDFTWTPTRLGTFNGQCAEFCGLGHARMTFVLKVVTEPDFLAWVKVERQ